MPRLRTTTSRSKWNGGLAVRAETVADLRLLSDLPPGLILVVTVSLILVSML
jgi:hypothetical protein